MNEIVDKFTDWACVVDAKPASKPSSRCDLCGALNHTICGALNAQELIQFSTLTRAIQVPEGSCLVREGDDDNLIFTVTTGCFKSYKQLADGRRQIMGFYFPGDFIGLSGSNHYQVDVEAVTQSSACQMRRSDLKLLSKQIPKIENRLYDLTSDALAELQGQLLLLGRKTAQERLATFIMMLADRAAEEAGEPASTVDVPMTRQDIADFLGLTIETVSRTFSALRKTGVIGTETKGRIDILDHDGLSLMAEN